MASANSAAGGSIDTEEPTMVMVRKPLPIAVVEEERTLVDVAVTSQQTASASPVAPMPARAASVSGWKNAPAQPPRPTPSVPRPRKSGPPPLPASVAAEAKRVAVPPLPSAAQGAKAARAGIAPAQQRV